MAEKVYTFYPGCALHATGRGYAVSSEACADALGIKLHELPDWNCCGATAYMSVRELMSFAISARNLALAEPLKNDLVTPCSACYVTLNKTNHYFHEFPETREKLNRILAEVGLQYKGTLNVRHLFYVIAEDIGIEGIREKVKRELKGLKVAPYYGCQLIRPYEGPENPDVPMMMDEMIKAMGGEPVYFPMKTKCCGASLIGSNLEVALQMVRDLLKCAHDNGAEVIITPCPLCQFNVEVYQDKIESLFGVHYRMPVLYFTQLLGLALGAPVKRLGLQNLIVPLEPTINRHALV